MNELLVGVVQLQVDREQKDHPRQDMSETCSNEFRRTRNCNSSSHSKNYWKFSLESVFIRSMKQERGTSNVSWNRDTEYALGLCKMISRLVGTWPLDCDNLFAKIRTCLVASFQITMNINLVRELKANCSPFNQMVDFVALLACSTMALLKVLVLRFKKKNMLIIVASAIEDWSSVVDNKSRLIMMSYAYLGRFVFIFQLSSAYAGVFSMFFGILLKIVKSELSFSSNSLLLDMQNVTMNISQHIRELPMGSLCFVTEMSYSSYIIVFLFQIFQLLMTCSCNIGSDVYFFSLVMHFCAQFNLLNNKIEKFGMSLKNIKCDNDYKKQLSKIVRRHNHLADMSHYFEETFNILILVQLVSSGIHISLLGIQLIIGLRHGDFGAIMYVVIALYVLNLQLFLYSYAGEQLSSKNADIRNAVYNCLWYTMSPRIMKDLLFLIMRCDCNFSLTAGRVYPMNIQNFKNILKAIVSYFSFLKLMLPGTNANSKHL